MLPGNTLASVHRYSEWKHPYPLTDEITKAYEWGGIDITDTSQGFAASLWVLQYISGELHLGKINTPLVPVLTVGAGVAKVALAFDTSMRPAYAWQIGEDSCVLRYYDTVLADFTEITFTGIYSPCLTLDDSRTQSSSVSDIIFAYLKGNQLCYRQQRDRFLIEYVLAEVTQQHLMRVGMTKSYRLQFMLR